MMMGQEQQQDSEHTARSQWLIQHLCQTDRLIVKRKRRDVQNLIQQIITEPVVDSPSPLAVVPLKKQTKSKKRAGRKGSLHLHLDWDAHWPSTDHFYQQIAYVLGVLPTTIQDGSKTTSAPPPQQNMIVAKTTTDRFDIKSLRSVMEHELQELGLARLHQMKCSTCHGLHSSDNLYTDPESLDLDISKDGVTRCGECFKGKVPSCSIFDELITGIAEKWAKMVGKRVECLYGDWDERLNPMVKMLKENVLLADDISALLRTCVDPHEFKDACEVIIITTIVFYLEYIDFRRSCEALLKVRPSVSHSQLFEIFAIYFPNRAKGIKTGDFL